MSDRVERYFNSLGKTIVLQTKKSLRKKKGSTSLGESIKYKVVKNPNGYTLQFYMEDYGTFLDKGVSGNKRKQQNKDVPYSEGCGGLMWDAWGGSAGVNWAISKLKEIDNK